MDSCVLGPHLRWVQASDLPVPLWATVASGRHLSYLPKEGGGDGGMAQT
jgi:hypothetical protein